VKRILLAGAGKIGSMIAGLLTSSGDYQVTVVDRSAGQLDCLPRSALLERRVLDLTNPGELLEALPGQFAVLSEYLQPCEAIVDGVLREVPALEELEEFSLDGVRYEDFNTSGGLGTLCEALGGKVRTLNYRTVRYPGHRDIMKALIHDLRLGQRPEVLKDILEHAIPGTMQDVVLVFVTVSGQKEGRLLQETYANKIYGGEVAGVPCSAIPITTASGIRAVLDLLALDKLPQKGFVRQEEIPLGAFLANRFGAAYALSHVAAARAA
jgi:saccharopine dehydrogenase-like NADP-dependent oxidoreductase